MQNLLCCCIISYFYLCRNCFNLLLITGKRLHHTIQIWFNNLLTVGEASKSLSLISSPSVPKVTFYPSNHVFPKHPQQPRAETTMEQLKGLDPNTEGNKTSYIQSRNSVSVPNNGNRPQKQAFNVSVCYVSKSSMRLTLDSAERFFYLSTFFHKRYAQLGSRTVQIFFHSRG